MKILVVSLLRLGDIIQQEPLLRGLRQKYPGAEIHLLMNRQFSSVERILGSLVDRYLHFDRESLQKGLGEASYNVLWSYRELEDLVRSLNREKYDLAFNFTHNKLSAYLLGALDIKQKNGLHHTEGKFSGLSNRWIRYFNERFSGTQKSLFHYVELLGHAFDLPVQPVASVERKKSKLILFQCLTSDVKKNWGLSQFLELKNALGTALPDHCVRVLGASFEREQLSSVFAESDILICDLQEARRHLQEAALLVTGDTSIKHLAAQIGTPLVELVLGSSDPVKTGAYADNARAVISQVACAPCSHSGACSQSSHLCAEDLTVEKVFAAVWDQLSGERQALDKTANDLERAVWTLYLNRERRDGEPFYRRAIEELLSQHAVESLQKALVAFQERGSQYSAWYQRIMQALPARESFLKRSTMQASDMGELILVAQDIIKSKKDEAGYYQGFIEALLSRYIQPVQIFDRVSAALADVEELLSLREQLIRHMQTFSREGVYYAKGIGQLSIGGFEETGKSVQRDLEDAGL